MLADVWKPGCLRKGPRRRGGPAPPPDPGQPPRFVSGRLPEPRLDQLAMFWSASQRRKDQWPWDMLQPDSEDSCGSHLVLCQLLVQLNSCIL